MATKLTQEFIASKALMTRTTVCHGHDSCEITYYTAAEKTMGGKAHSYSYTVHSSDGKVLSGSFPYCGSRNRSTSSHGSFVNEITCGRCK